MTAIAGRLHYRDSQDGGTFGPSIQPQKTGLDDDAFAYITKQWRKRCASLCLQRDLVWECLTPLESSASLLSTHRKKESWPCRTLEDKLRAVDSPLCDPFPSYHNDSLAETRSHDDTETLALVKPPYQHQTLPSAFEYLPPKTSKATKNMPGPDIDLNDISNIRSVAGKKAKKAQKAADQAKWADGGDEDDKGGAEGEENPEGGGGSGGNNGDGGAGGDGGGGGDEWNDWDTGNKKKKGKKAKEDEKKKQEEEEEKKRKEEEETANGQNPLSWADETNGDDDWGGFATATTKKDKKGKKGKNDLGPEKSNGVGNFDDINLNDDAPKLDLDFGSNEKKDSGFGFNGWGGGGNASSWNTGNNWSFGNDAGTTDIVDSFTNPTTTDTGDTGAWSFGGNKKNKKKTTSSGFDFGDFGTLDEEQGGEAKAEDTQEKDDDGWGAGVTATGKKGKKDKKKSIFSEPSNDPDPSTIGTAIAEPDPVAEDTWGTGWGTSSAGKNKKKGKKTDEEIPPPPPAAPTVPTETSMSDDWGGFGSKKDKKKGKKITEVEEPTPIALPEPEPEVDVGWGSFGKKDKKKVGKKETEKPEEPTAAAVIDPEPDLDFGWGSAKKTKKKGGKAESEKAAEPETTAVPEADLDLDFGWGSTKKDTKKKGKKDDKVEEPLIAAAPDPAPADDIGWSAFGKKEKKKGGKIEEPVKPKDPEPEPDLDDWTSFGAKKDKKKKKSGWEDPEEDEKPATEEVPQVDTTTDTGWGFFGSKKDKKKVKNDPLGDIPPPPPDPEPLVEEKPPLSRTGSKKDKKGKKGLLSEVKDDLIPATDAKAPTDAATSVVADDDWMGGWGSNNKKKDSKKNKRNSLASSKDDDAPPPPPPVSTVPDVPDPSSFDIWGSSNKKDKKGKKGKVADAEPEIIPIEDPVETKDDQSEEDWAASIRGLSAKDKKKKEKEREKAKKEKEEREKLEKEEQERKEEEERIAKEEEEEKEKAAKAKEKVTVKGKVGKKGKTSTSPVVSKTKDLLEDSVPDIAPTVEEDTWGSWGGAKKDKKKGVKKDMDFDPPPPAPTPPAQGLTPEPEEDEWASFAPSKTAKGKKEGKKDGKVDDSKSGKKGAKDKIEDIVEEKKAAKEDTPAKAAKSFWGGMGAASVSKAKSSKADEKAKKDAEVEAEMEAEGDPDEIVDIIEEPVKKSSKDKSGAKLSKTSTKDSDKTAKSGDAKKSMWDNDAPTAAAAATTKGKDGKASKGLDKDDEKADLNNTNDAFASLWGSSKKTSGKKGDEAKNKIGKENPTNQKGSVKKGAWNEPEATDIDDQAWAAQPAKEEKSSKSAMSTAKTSKQSSVLQKVRELERNKLAEASLSPPPPPPPADPVPTSKTDKKGGTSKSKDLASNKTTSSKKKGLLSENVDDKKVSIDSVPGSFPGEGMDDDFGDLLDASPIEKEETKENKKSAKSTKQPKASSKARETPESKRPPTPPPEPKEEKPAKKERARVAKTGGATSWGMWGAPTPSKDGKKDSKSKDDADIVSPPKKEKVAAPGLARSKSTKTAREKDKETVRSDPKSSDSDKPKKSESRPPKSRGSSFGGLFGGTPARAKPVRRSSTATSGPKIGSQRESIDMDATGLPSPPAEEPSAMTGKAAKLMGVKGGKLDRKSSTKGKSKISSKPLLKESTVISDDADGVPPAAPDPYAIDSDDMVMVNEHEDPIINAPIPKKGSSKSKTKQAIEPEPVASFKKDLPDRSKSKRDSKLDSSKSKRQSKAFNDFDDDVVMVDAGPSDSPEIADGPDDMQFITKPKGLQRTPTSSKKSENKMGGLLNAFRKNKNEGGELPRKRTVTGGDDSAKRPRRDDRRRSEKVSSRAEEGYVYDAPGDFGGVTEGEEVDARKEERKAKRVDKDRAAKEAREDALRYEADRRTKRRAAEKDKLKDEKDRKARKAEEAEAKAQEDKEARRAAREARRAEESANRELEDDILKPRTKRRESDNKEASRPSKSDRRRSHYDKPIPQPADEAEARHARREERRTKSDRRKSTAAPVDDYFDPRNGKQSANDPYGNAGGKDHTASWVESLAKESPEPPPLEPTIMEPAPDLRAQGADDLQAEEDLRRSSHRKSKRSSRMYPPDPPPEDQQDERRRRRESKREGVRSGEGSAEEERFRSPRRQSDLGGVKLGAGTKTFDGKTGQGKRASWFQKIGGRGLI